MPFKDVVAKKEYQRQWYANRRAGFFEGKACVECGDMDNLELDHIDPSQKVSHRIWSWSADRRAEEIAKCQVLCSECHLAKTRSERPKPRCGTEWMYHKGCRCEDCRHAHRLARRAYVARRAA